MPGKSYGSFLKQGAPVREGFKISDLGSGAFPTWGPPKDTKGYVGIMARLKAALIRDSTIVCWGYIGDNGKENGNSYIIIGYILGLYTDNGKENGNYYKDCFVNYTKADCPPSSFVFFAGCSYVSPVPFCP